MRHDPEHRKATRAALLLLRKRAAADADRKGIFYYILDKKHGCEAVHVTISRQARSRLFKNRALILSHLKSLGFLGSGRKPVKLGGGSRCCVGEVGFDNASQSFQFTITNRRGRAGPNELERGLTRIRPVRNWQVLEPAPGGQQAEVDARVERSTRLAYRGTDPAKRLLDTAQRLGRLIVATFDVKRPTREQLDAVTRWRPTMQGQGDPLFDGTQIHYHQDAFSPDLLGTLTARIEDYLDLAEQRAGQRAVSAPEVLREWAAPGRELQELGFDKQPLLAPESLDKALGLLATYHEILDEEVDTRGQLDSLAELMAEIRDERQELEWASIELPPELLAWDGGTEDDLLLPEPGTVTHADVAMSDEKTRQTMRSTAEVARATLATLAREEPSHTTVAQLDPAGLDAEQRAVVEGLEEAADRLRRLDAAMREALGADLISIQLDALERHYADAVGDALQAVQVLVQDGVTRSLGKTPREIGSQRERLELLKPHVDGLLADVSARISIMQRARVALALAHQHELRQEIDAKWQQLGGLLAETPELADALAQTYSLLSGMIKNTRLELGGGAGQALVRMAIEQADRPHLEMQHRLQEEIPARTQLLKKALKKVLKRHEHLQLELGKKAKAGDVAARLNAELLDNMKSYVSMLGETMERAKRKPGQIVIERFERTEELANEIVDYSRQTSELLFKLGPVDPDDSVIRTFLSAVKSIVESGIEGVTVGDLGPSLFAVQESLAEVQQRLYGLYAKRAGLPCPEPFAGLDVRQVDGLVAKLEAAQRHMEQVFEHAVDLKSLYINEKLEDMAAGAVRAASRVGFARLMRDPEQAAAHEPVFLGMIRRIQELARDPEALGARQLSKEIAKAVRTLWPVMVGLKEVAAFKSTRDPDARSIERVIMAMTMFKLSFDADVRGSSSYWRAQDKLDAAQDEVSQAVVDAGLACANVKEILPALRGIDAALAEGLARLLTHTPTRDEAAYPLMCQGLEAIRAGVVRAMSGREGGQHVYQGRKVLDWLDEARGALEEMAAVKDAQRGVLAELERIFDLLGIQKVTMQKAELTVTGDFIFSFNERSPFGDTGNTKTVVLSTLSRPSKPPTPVDAELRDRQWEAIQHQVAKTKRFLKKLDDRDLYERFSNSVRKAFGDRHQTLKAAKRGDL